MTTKAEELAQQLKERHGSNVLTSQAAALLRNQDEAIRVALEYFEKLARLGNGERYGNSDGNMIALDAIAKLREVQG